MFNKTLSSGVTNETEIDSIFNENGEIFDNRMIAKVSYGIIGVLAFTSNLVFFVAMNRKKKTLKTGYDILITSLAIADMLTGLFIIVTPNYVIGMSLYSVPGGIAGEIFCRMIFSKFFIFTFGKGSVLTITCLAVERWFVLLKPLHYQKTFSHRKLIKYIGCIWFSCACLQSYKLFYVKYFQHSCFFIPLPLAKSQETAVVIIYVSLTFFLPTFITWAAFLHIFVEIKKSNALKENRGKINKRRLLRMCAIMSLMLTVCWFPTEVCYLINQYGFPILNFGTPFREFTVALALANSFVNPWIYVVSNRKYRRAIMTFLALCHQDNSM